MREPRKADPPPLRTDDVRTVAVGTVLWLVALLALLPFWSRLSDGGRLWWVATCACGFALGLVGLAYTRRRAAAIARDEAAAASASARASDEGPFSPGP
ncbi:MAG TPA: DUF2530 domain-containing protein [Frankiaceae bacterium]|jgi:peptidoglycan/LPS O-acetylase OafA/YrhL|nr:DUF2530 domain-containing protein [Frankiaceae bacterium]